MPAPKDPLRLEETREKLRQQHAINPNMGMHGKRHSPETREKMRLATLGQRHSEETKAKLREATLRQWAEGRVGRADPELLRQKAIGRKMPLAMREKARLAKLGLRGEQTNHYGHHHSEEQRANIRRGLQNMSAEALARMVLAPRTTHPTSLERRLYAMLENCWPDYKPQVRFGRYVVDAFVPSCNLAFEADGYPWHEDIERDAIRDAALLKMGIGAVIHLRNAEIPK